MPKAFDQAGYASGVLNTILIGIICTWGLHILVRKSIDFESGTLRLIANRNCAGSVTIHSVQEATCSHSDVSDFDEDRPRRRSTDVALASTGRCVRHYHISASFETYRRVALLPHTLVSVRSSMDSLSFISWAFVVCTLCSSRGTSRSWSTFGTRCQSNII